MIHSNICRARIRSKAHGMSFRHTLVARVLKERAMLPYAGERRGTCKPLPQDQDGRRSIWAWFGGYGCTLISRILHLSTSFFIELVLIFVIFLRNNINKTYQTHRVPFLTSCVCSSALSTGRPHTWWHPVGARGLLLVDGEGKHFSLQGTFTWVDWSWGSSKSGPRNRLPKADPWDWS